MNLKQRDEPWQGIAKWAWSHGYAGQSQFDQQPAEILALGQFDAAAIDLGDIADDGQTQPGTELRRLAPAQVSAWHDRLVERHDLVARMPQASKVV